MKDHDYLPDELAGLRDAKVYNHGFLPVAAIYCKKLKLAEVVDQMVSSNMELHPGLVVQAMVLDVLSGRTLYTGWNTFLQLRIPSCYWDKILMFTVSMTPILPDPLMPLYNFTYSALLTS